jgi:hypothetical protein
MINFSGPSQLLVNNLSAPFTGTCAIEISDDTSIKCSFISTSLPSAPGKLAFGRDDYCYLTARLANGAQLILEGPFNATFQFHVGQPFVSTFDIFTNNVHLDYNNARAIAYCHYLLSGPAHFIEMPFDIPLGNFMHLLHCRDGLYIFCNLMSSLGTTAVDDFVNSFCLACSFALKTPITWKVKAAFDITRSPKTLEFRHIIATPDASNPLIKYTDLPSFLEGSLVDFDRMRQQMQLDAIIGFHLYAEKELYTQAKFISAYTALEILCNQDANRDRYRPKFLICEDFHDGSNKAAREQILDIIKSLMPRVSGEMEQLLKSKIHSLNNPSNYDRINAICKYYTGLEFPKGVYKARNKLLHCKVDETEMMYRMWALISYFIDKIMMKIVGFHGAYNHKASFFVHLDEICKDYDFPPM